MLKLLALLPCLLLVAEASRGCEELIQCQDMVAEEGFFVEDASMTSYINEAQVMDSVCTQLSPLTSCISNKLSGCHDDTVRNEVKAVEDVLEYMCTPEGRELVVRLANSQCADGPLMEVRMETMMQGCLETFQFDVQMEALNAAFSGREPVMSDFCPFIDELKTCLVEGSTNMCGADMGTFIGNIWDIAARDQFAEFGCTSTVALRRRYVRRALPMLMKRSQMVRKLRK